MNPSRDLALILIRFLGVACFLLGGFGTVYALLVFMLRAIGVDSDLMDAIWSEGAQSFVTGLYWMFFGVFTLFLSRHLAAWIARFSVGDN